MGCEKCFKNENDTTNNLSITFNLFHCKKNQISNQVVFVVPGISLVKWGLLAEKSLKHWFKLEMRGILVLDIDAEKKK